MRSLESLVLGPYKGRFLDEVFSRIDRGDEVVLDLGAGSGYFSLQIARRLMHGRVICLDQSDVMLRRLKQRARTAGLSKIISIVRCNASCIGLKSGSVDLVISSFLLHELIDPPAALAEVARVLRPGGSVVATDFRNTVITRRMLSHHSKEVHGPFTVSELSAALDQAGLDEVNVRSIWHYILATAKR